MTDPEAPASATERDPARLLAALDAMTQERDRAVRRVRFSRADILLRKNRELRARLARVAALAEECDAEAKRLIENATRLRRTTGEGAALHTISLQWAIQDERGADRETRFARALRAALKEETPGE